MKKREELTRSEVTETSISMPMLNALDDPLPHNVSFDVIQEEASNIIDRIEFSLPPADDSHPSHVSSAGGVLPSMVDSFDPESIASLEPNLASTHSRSELEFSYMSSTVNAQVDLPAETEATGTEQGHNCFSDESAVLSTAYDFLKDDPVVLAELSKQPHPQGNMAAVLDTTIPMDDLKILAEVVALQRIQDLTGGAAGISVYDGTHPPTGDDRSGGNDGVSVPSLSKTDSTNSGPSGSGPGSASGPLPLLIDGGPVDFLEKGLDPDQVLDQLQKLKEAYGGTLTPDQMDPFLDYFGELSSRELDRIEALEAKSNPKKKGGSGEARKKKRNMAIRFPSQSKATPLNSCKEWPAVSSSDLGVPVDKLPVADFGDLSSSDESDGRGSPIKPLSREDFIREALKKEGNLPRPLGTDSLRSGTDLNDFLNMNSAMSELDIFLREQGRLDL